MLYAREANMEQKYNRWIQRQSCYTAFSFFLIFFFFIFFVFLFFIFGQNLSTFIDGRFNPIDPSGETTSFPSRRRRFSLLFAHQRRFTSIQTRNGKKTVRKPGRNTENICNLNSPGGKRIRYFRDSVLRYLGTAAGEFQKWVLGKFVYPRRWMRTNDATFLLLGGEKKKEKKNKRR